MPDKLSSVARHFAFWLCFSKKRCPANFNCLYKAFFLIFPSPVYLLSVLKLDIMSKELPTSYRINQTCPAKLETIQIVRLFWTFGNVREKRFELISRKMTNDDEWLWNSVKCKIWFTMVAYPVDKSGSTTGGQSGQCQLGNLNHNKNSFDNLYSSHNSRWNCPVISFSDESETFHCICTTILSQ